jgi:hypothetical protein
LLQNYEVIQAARRIQAAFLEQPAPVFTVFLRPFSDGHEPVSACAEKAESPASLQLAGIGRFG